MPGIFAQTIVFAAGTTAIGMTDDINKGIIDRFRSLPMARSAVLTRPDASPTSSTTRGILIVLMLTGLAVGWRVDTGIVSLRRRRRAAAALRLRDVLARRLARPQRARRSRSRSRSIFTVLFPLTFISNVFVPLETLPSWLQPIAEWNPTSTLTAALRDLWGNPNPATSTSLATTEPALVTIVWVFVFIAVFGPLSLRRYRSMSR